MASQGGEAVEEIIFRTEHDRRAQDGRGGECIARRLLASPLARDIGRRGRCVRPDPGNMHISREARACRGSRQRESALDMHGRVGLRPALGLNARGVDGHACALERSGDRIREAKIGLHRLDLSNSAHRPKEPGEIGSPDGDAHAPSLADERPDDMASQESGPAEYCRQTVVFARGVGHRRLHQGRGSPPNMRGPRACTAGIEVRRWSFAARPRRPDPPRARKAQPNDRTWSRTRPRPRSPSAIRR